jgi:homocitrate synthase NifV
MQLLEEVVMALKYLSRIDLNFKTDMFREASEYVARASGRELPVWKAIVGLTCLLMNRVFMPMVC